MNKSDFILVIVLLFSFSSSKSVKLLSDSLQDLSVFTEECPLSGLVAFIGFSTRVLTFALELYDTHY